MEGDVIDDGGDIHRKLISEDVTRKADRVSGCLVENLDCTHLNRSRAWLECADPGLSWCSAKEDVPADIKRRKSGCEDDEVRNGNGELINRKEEEAHFRFWRGAGGFF